MLYGTNVVAVQHWFMCGLWLRNNPEASADNYVGSCIHVNKFSGTGTNSCATTTTTTHNLYNKCSVDNERATNNKRSVDNDRTRNRQ